MLGLIDAVALAPRTFAAAVLAGRAIAVRVGLVLLAGVGPAGAARQLRRCRSEALDTAPANSSYAGVSAVVVFDAVEGFYVPLRLSPPA